MIKSAEQWPVHALLSHDSRVVYHVPPYQREYTWQRPEWDELFDDLIEADGSHFLGTIITLNQTQDAIRATVLELIDGQQRMTTLTLLMAAVYSILRDNHEVLTDDQRLDQRQLGKQLIHRENEAARVRPQRQGHNLEDYLAVLTQAGLALDVEPINYMPRRRISRCYRHFRDEIISLAEERELTQIEAATLVLEAAKQATIVKIEVANHADAFVLFESLNNRGVPLTPVDLIKNHLLADSERKQTMTVDEAFKRWNEMLTNLGDNYSNQDRFLRHYYNAFKSDLPSIPNASLATRANLIRIYETLVEADGPGFLDLIIPASRHYGRITGQLTDGDDLDAAFRQLDRIQGAPSYVLLLWLMVRQEALGITDAALIATTDLLSSFFVRRNLTGSPPTYALPKLFTGIIEQIAADPDADVVETIRAALLRNSVSDDVFRESLLDSIYEQSADVARFILTTLSEDAMTKESQTDLWRRENKRFVWTIEHILPQGENLPQEWVDMLGGTDQARLVQSEHVHRLGNLTITGYNSTLSNKSFAEKKHRKDRNGRPIGYLNGLALNADLVGTDAWGHEQIEDRTNRLADQVLARFRLTV